MRLIQAGPRQTKIVLVSEAPTKAEYDAGEPFTGGAGQLLSHMLSRSGISMSSCFRTNLVHTPPPAAVFENFYRKANQLPYVLGVMQLKKDLEEIRPNLVIGLGANALRALTGKKGIEKYRGSILSSTLVKEQKVICTFSHGFPMKIWEAKTVIEMDLARCAGDMHFPELRLPIREHFLNPNAAVRRAIVEEMLRAEWLAVDIECALDEKTGKWRLVCVGFSDRPGRSLVIPWGDESARHDIRCLVESPAKKVYQNGMFDVSFMRECGLNPQNFAWDTMFAHHCLMLECASGEDEMSKLSGKKKVSVLRKGLGFQTSIYTREQYYKDDGKVDVEGIKDINEFYLYNGKDNAVTREIRDVQQDELAEFGAWPSFLTEMALVEPLMYATKRGILIDMSLRGEIQSEFEVKIDNLQKALDTGAGWKVNVKSTHKNGDMQKLLYDVLKLPVKYNRKTKNPTADKDAINELAAKYTNPLLHIVLRIREYRDFVERYLSAAVGADGRMRCSFDVTGTKTGRLSSRASLDGTGTNLHTIPVRKKEGTRLRQMFIADPGKIFVSRDYKQGETWFVAYLSRCERLIELLNDPTRDIHRETAARLYNIDVSEVSDFPQRYLGKRTGHGSNYGLTGDKLYRMIEEDAEATGVHSSIREAQTLIDKYFMIYPEIKENYWHEVKQQIMTTRTLTTCFGRKRIFNGDMRSAQAQENLLRDAYSWHPQSGLGDLGNMATARCYNEIQIARPELGAEYLLSVHDSILMQCDIGREYETAAAMEECMKIPATIYGRTFIVPSDCQVGFNWNKKGKDGSNPLGLRDIEKWHGIQDIQI